jgi:hypothetical protein
MEIQRDPRRFADDDRLSRSADFCSTPPCYSPVIRWFAAASFVFRGVSE